MTVRVFRVTLTVPVDTNDQPRPLALWDWEDLVGIGTEYVKAKHLYDREPEPEREWHPMNLAQMKEYLSGYVVGDLPVGYETRETEHGVEYR